MTNTKKLGDTVRGTWRTLSGDVAIEGVLVAFDTWHGEVMATVALAAPVLWCNPPRPGVESDVRTEVTIEARYLTIVASGPVLADGEVSGYTIGRCASLSTAALAARGLVRAA